MATKIFRGDAAAIAQVNTFTFAGTWEATDIVRVVIGSKTYDFVGGSTTITTVIDTIVTAWAALSATTYPEFAEITPTRSSSSLVLTAATAGIPFTATITPLETGGGAADAQTIEGGTSATTGTATTANAGPECWDTAANWSPSGVPASSDTVYFQASSVNCRYGLSQSAVTLTALIIDQSYTGEIGLTDFQGTYYEYRTTELTIGVTTLTIGRGEGQGSGLIRINTGSVACTATIYDTGSPKETGLAAFRFRGTSSSNAVNVLKGIIDIAYAAGHTADLTGGLTVGFRTNVEGDAAVRCGSGVTLATINKSGGTLEVNSNTTTITTTGGETNFYAGTLTTLTIRDSAIVNYNSTGTLTTATVSGSGLIDFTRDMRTKTVTNPIVAYGDNSRVRDTFKVVTGLVVDRKESKDLSNLDIGTNVRITRGTPA